MHSVIALTFGIVQRIKRKLPLGLGIVVHVDQSTPTLTDTVEANQDHPFVGKISGLHLISWYPIGAKKRKKNDLCAFVNSVISVSTPIKT